MNQRRLLVGSIAVVLLALAVRLGPLHLSSLPFNPDGFTHASVAEDLLALGEIPVDDIATDQVGYASLLGVLSALTGDTPLAIGQPVSALVGALSVLVVVTLAHRIALAANWSPTRARAAAFVAGLTIALEGVYLYRSMPTDEQTAGFLLVGALVLGVDRWTRSGQWYWGIIGAILLVPLGPLHNLTGLIGAASVTVVGALASVDRSSLPAVRRAVLATLLAWTYVLGYHLVVASYTGAEIVQAERLLAVPGLVVAWLVLVVLGSIWYVTTSERLRRGVVLWVLIGGFALVGLNALRPIYPGTTETPGALLLTLSPLVVPAVVAGLVAHVFATRTGAGASSLALVAGPLAFVGTGLTAGLTFEYLSMVWRAQLFVHLPIAALVGLGTVTVARRVERRHVRVAIVLVVLCCVAASTPIAYGELDVRSYKSVTTEADFVATEHVAGTGTVATDDHLARILGYHGGSGDQSAIFRWLDEGGDAPTCPVLARDSWTSVGAQLHPQRPATVDEDAFRTWRSTNDVPYTVLAEDSLSLVRPREQRASGC